MLDMMIIPARVVGMNWTKRATRATPRASSFGRAEPAQGEHHRSLEHAQAAGGRRGSPMPRAETTNTIRIAPKGQIQSGHGTDEEEEQAGVENPDHQGVQPQNQEEAGPDIAPQLADDVRGQSLEAGRGDELEQ